MAGLGLNFKYLGAFWRIRVEADDEFLCVDRYLNDTFKGDAALLALATGGVHGEDVPEGTTLPYVAFEFRRAEQDDGAGYGMEANLVYAIGAFAKTSNYAALAPIVGRLKLLLNVKPPARGDGTIVSCTRIMPTRAPFSKDY